ncbi:MAG: hypothetical protein ACI92Z_003248 [Paracoccaceae bacterium]
MELTEFVTRPQFLCKIICVVKSEVLNLYWQKACCDVALGPSVQIDTE